MILALLACSNALVKPGPAVAAGSVAVVTPIAWTRFSGPRGEVWTVDGALLDRVEFYADIRDGQNVFKTRHATKSKPDGPYYHPGMDGPAQAQLIADALGDIGGVKPVIEALRPARYGSHDAVRFELRLANDEGLIYRGSALVAEVDGKLTVLLYLAPAEHYFEAYWVSIDSMLRSARPK